MIATTFENTAETETPKEEKKQSWLQSAFNAVTGGLRSFDNWLEYQLTSDAGREFDEFQRQEEIQWLYESVYTQGEFTDGEEFKKDLEKLLKMNEHIIHIHGEITMDDLSNYHMVLNDDKKAELDKLRTNYQQENNNIATLEV